MKGRRIFACSVALALLAALVAGLSQAQGPEPEYNQSLEGASVPAAVEGVVTHDIPIQGRLTDASGHAVPDGIYTITFRLYNVASGGDPLVEDTDNPEVTNGLFSALIGPCASDDINGQELWLGVQVEGDEEMLPRQQIAPVPYALGLRPGATILGDVANGSVLQVHNGSTSSGSRGVYGRAYGLTGITYGVYGESYSADGYGGYFVSTTLTGNGVGLYARGAGNDSPDLVLGANSSSSDDGRIYSEPASASSDLLLVSNDDVRFDLDENEDEDGAFRIFNGANNQVLGAYETGLVRMGINAGPAQPIDVGDRYRDNAIVAWAKISGGNPGSITAEFGISSVDHYNTGCYKIYLDIRADAAASLIPMAIAEIDSAPVGAGALRIVSVNQLEPNIFNVYINDGNGNLVNNDFVFMATAR